mmetsp:Transcript_73347/g.148401  ORF Transcript_73347/g.148401 Transcript_73347/m.148401 type:complete len:201 (+) Transcript_73347:1278-1880(+)
MHHSIRGARVLPGGHHGRTPQGQGVPGLVAATTPGTSHREQRRRARGCDGGPRPRELQGLGHGQPRQRAAADGVGDGDLHVYGLGQARGGAAADLLGRRGLQDLREGPRGGRTPGERDGPGEASWRWPRPFGLAGTLRFQAPSAFSHAAAPALAVPAASVQLAAKVSNPPTTFRLQALRGPGWGYPRGRADLEGDDLPKG